MICSDNLKTYEVFFVDPSAYYNMVSHEGASYRFKDVANTEAKLRAAISPTDPSAIKNITCKTCADYLREGHTDEIDWEELERWRMEHKEEDEETGRRQTILATSNKYESGLRSTRCELMVTSPRMGLNGTEERSTTKFE